MMTPSMSTSLIKLIITLGLTY